jgi:Domain of unknown function (DUF1996)
MILKSRVFITILFLLSRRTTAFFKFPCSQPVVLSRLDLIISPGTISGHLHTIMGSFGISSSSTYSSLTSPSTCSTCQISPDHSAYWTPTLFYRSKDGSNFTSVAQNGGSLMYYLFRRDNENIPLVAYPEGFRMITGSPLYRGDQGTLDTVSTATFITAGM